MRRKLITAVLVLAGVLGLALATSSSAGAATVWQWDSFSTIGGTVCISGHCVPQGTLELLEDSYDSRNQQVFRIQGSFAYIGCVSGWWIDANIYDRSGNRLYHGQGAAHNCSSTGSAVYDLPLPSHVYPPGGNVCVTMWRTAAFGPAGVGATCIGIRY